MKRKFSVLSSFLVFSVFLAKAELANSGMSFLQISSSAASASSANVFAQSAQSPLAIFENPVGIRNENVTFALSHHFWFSNISLDALAFSIPLQKSTLGFGLNYVRIPGVEIRETPSSEPLAEVEPQYMAAAVGYTFSPVTNLLFGVTGKYLHEHLYTYTDYGFAFDFAVHWDAPSMLDVSVMVKNIGMLHSDTEVNNLPSTLTIGVIRPELFEGQNLNAGVGVNFGSNLNSQEAFVAAGLDLNFRNLLCLRGGFIHVGAINRKSLGFGLNIERFKIDYAYLFMPEGLHNPHILTISYRP